MCACKVRGFSFLSVIFYSALPFWELSMRLMNQKVLYFWVNTEVHHMNKQYRYRKKKKTSWKNFPLYLNPCKFSLCYWGAFSSLKIQGRNTGPKWPTSMLALAIWDTTLTGNPIVYGAQMFQFQSHLCHYYRCDHCMLRISVSSSVKWGS